MLPRFYLSGFTFKYSLPGSLWKWADFLIHKAFKSAQEVCVSVHRFLFFFLLRGAVFLEDLSFYWLQLYIIIIVLINLPQISRRTLIRNILLCSKYIPKLKAQWKTGGPTFTYYHGTEVKPKDRNKIKQK